MRVEVALIPVFSRFVDGDKHGHLVALHQHTTQCHGQRFARPLIQFIGQADFKLTRQAGIGATLVRLIQIPEHMRIQTPIERALRCKHLIRRNTMTMRVAMQGVRSGANQIDTRAICGRGN